MAELNKKLAEWAGFKEIVLTEFNIEAFTPDGWAVMLPFTESLDACFKWLVPKLIDTNIYPLTLTIYKSNMYGYHFELGNHGFTADANTPALALCKTIEKLINSEAK